jgi:hypothetical protein
MLRTITIGSCVSVQGLFVSQLANGKIVVQVGNDTFIGTPVPVARLN